MQAHPYPAASRRRRRWQPILAAVGVLCILAGLSPIGGGSTTGEQLVVPLELPRAGIGASGKARRHAEAPVARAAAAPSRPAIARNRDDAAPLAAVRGQQHPPASVLRVPSTRAVTSAPDEPGIRPPHARVAAPPAAEAAPATSAPAGAPKAVVEHDIGVARGESLYTIFRSRGFSIADLMAVMKSDPRARGLATLRPGDRIRVSVDADDRLHRLVHVRASGEALHVARRGDAFEAQVGTVPVPRTALGPKAPGDTAAGKPAAGRLEPRLSSRSVTVTRGDSLYSIFKTNGFQLTDLAAILGTGSEAKALRRLVPGQRLEFQVDEHLGIAKLVHHFDEMRSSHFTRDDQGYRYELVRAPIERRVRTAHGTIESSLFLAGQRAGLSDNVIMQLAEIFGWDMDFVLDIRSGDHFTIIYDELYKDGQKIRDGAILAAKFVNQGRQLRAVRYTFPDGRSDYFTPEGVSVRKAFLRTPVTFSRISSRFNPRRLHPVLHKIRAHRGVDYAAPRGTPVKASGDGKVIYVGRKGGYGKTVVLKHGATYSTLYGHLSRFARGLRRGARVRQGQIIGYVGSTGLATGSHLHYEFRVRGVHRDPLRVKLPKAAPIAAEFKEDFLVATRALVDRLDLLSRTMLASEEGASEEGRVVAD